MFAVVLLQRYCCKKTTFKGQTSFSLCSESGCNHELMNNLHHRLYTRDGRVRPPWSPAHFHSFPNVNYSILRSSSTPPLPSRKPKCQPQTRPFTNQRGCHQGWTLVLHVPPCYVCIKNKLDLIPPCDIIPSPNPCRQLSTGMCVCV